MSINFSTIRDTSGRQDCIVMWRLSLLRVKQCISSTTVEAGKMLSECRAGHTVRVLKFLMGHVWTKRRNLYLKKKSLGSHHANENNPDSKTHIYTANLH